MSLGHNLEKGRVKAEMKEVKRWIKKKNIKKPGTDTAWFTIRWVTFNPKRYAMTSSEVKDEIRKWMKKSRAVIENEYDVIYAKASRAGRATTGYKTEYMICVKPFANTIFVIPKKHRKEARKIISELTVDGNFTFN